MHAADDPLPSNADVLQNRADLAEGENRDESNAAAAERAYVKSLVKRWCCHACLWHVCIHQHVDHERAKASLVQDDTSDIV